MDCLYCGCEMSLLESFPESDTYICDCGACGEDSYTLGVYFELRGEDRQTWMSSQYYDEMIGARDAL